MEYQSQFDVEEDKKWQIGALSLVITYHVAELICYVAIYVHLKRHDRSIQHLLSRDAYNARRRSHVVSLYLQIQLFVMEVSGGIAVAITVFFTQYRWLSVFGIIGTNPLISIMIILSSKPLRKTMMELCHC